MERCFVKQKFEAGYRLTLRLIEYVPVRARTLRISGFRSPSRLDRG